MKRLSIIVPVYQVEQYIRDCVESIFMQDMDEDDFEVILVDDGTRDQSFERISDITSLHRNIIITRQDNQGLSAARNTGLTKASGAYILFLDSDDVLVSRSIKDLVDLATEKDADLLIAGFEKVTDESLQTTDESLQTTNESLQELCRRVSPVGSMLSYEEKTGSKAFIHDLNSRECYVWRTLYKKTFLDANNLRFIPGIYFEDVPFTTECYLKAGRCIKTDSLFYLYRQREQSICSTLDARKIYDLNTVIARLWNMRQEMKLTAKEDEKYMDVIFTTFSITQWYITQYDNLFRERHQLIADLKQKVPDLRFPYTKKQRSVTFFYRLMPCKYLWLRRSIEKVVSLFK